MRGSKFPWRRSGLLLLPALALCLSGCLEGPSGKEGAAGFGSARDSIIVDLKSAWEFNYLHYPHGAAVFGLSETEREAYARADTSLLRRDTLPNDLFVSAKYAPREWVAYYEFTNQIACEKQPTAPPDWIARFADTAAIEESYFCVDRGQPFLPVRGNSLLQYFDGKGFDIGSYFPWERIPIGRLRIYYW